MRPAPRGRTTYGRREHPDSSRALLRGRWRYSPTRHGIFLVLSSGNRAIDRAGVLDGEVVLEGEVVLSRVGYATDRRAVRMPPA